MTTKKPQSDADFEFGANVEPEPEPITALTVVPEAYRGIMNVKQYEAFISEMDETASEDMFGVNLQKLIPRIKVPSGGGTAWDIPGAEPKRMIEGVVVVVQRSNAFWWPKRHPSYSEADKLPVCSSADMMHGSHEPLVVVSDSIYSTLDIRKMNGREEMFGACALCLLNQYGSAMGDDGMFKRGKACKNTVRLYMFDIEKFLGGNEIPYLITIPPSSIGAWDNYVGLVKQSAGGRGSTMMFTTKMSLEVQSGDGSIKYSTVKFELGANLLQNDPALLGKLAEWRRAQKEVLRQVQITVDDYAD